MPIVGWCIQTDDCLAGLGAGSTDEQSDRQTSEVQSNDANLKIRGLQCVPRLKVHHCVHLG